MGGLESMLIFIPDTLVGQCNCQHPRAVGCVVTAMEAEEECAECSLVHS